MLLTGCRSSETISVQESTKATYKDIQSKISEYMNKYTEEIAFNGTILIAKNNDVLFSKGYGMSDYNNNTVNTPQTVFEIGSITKQFTASAILMLQEKKLLSVQDTLDKYIPDYPNGDKIKIQNLLNHTSGIPEYLGFIKFDKIGIHSYTTEEIIELVKNKPLEFKTGTKFKYSNSNYLLLGYIIEKISNLKYEDYIEKNILKPLNMDKTGFLSRQNIIKYKAIGYERINAKANEYKAAYEEEPSLPYAAGEIYSTTEDLYRWESALYKGRLIKKELLNEMLTPCQGSYGYGWFLQNTSRDKIAYHGGNIPGYTAYVEINIDQNYLFIILSNKEHDEAINSIPTGLSPLLKTT
jgi:CubicO group peptidase (beta-lactamase class C family)